MTFAADMVSDMSVFFNSDEFGTAMTYTPDNSDTEVTEPVSCVVLLDKNVELQPSDYDAETAEYVTTIEALRSVVATPQKGSYFSTSTKKYTVHRILDDSDDTTVTVAVTESDL